MNRPMEDRVRAAFDAKASQVTEAALSRSAADLGGPLADGERDTFLPEPGWQRRRSGGWLRPISAAAAIAALSGGLYWGAIRTGTTERPSAPSTRSASSSATTGLPVPSGPPASSAPSGPPASIGAGATPGVSSVREAPRGEIPWTQVGPGWSVTVWSPTVSSGPGTLYLVSPAGTRYAVGSVPPETRVSDVAPDGRRALLTRSSGTGAETVTEWDVTSGRQIHSFDTTYASSPEGVRYTRPAAKSVLVDTTEGLQRRSIDGSLEQAYSTSNHPSAALPTPDGLDIFAEVDNGLALLGNGGTLVRSFSAPAGYERCGPLRWWQPGVALTVCLQMGTPITNLFLYPISGAPVTQLTKATNAAPGGQNAPFGFVAAWRYSGGTLVQYGAGCGLGGVGMLSPDGLTTPRRLNIAATGNDGGPSLSVVNDTAYVTVVGCAGQNAQSLATYDLVKDTATVILGPKVNGGTVVDFFVIDPTR